MVQRVREIKSAAEVGKIRTSCAIADRAFARVPSIARGDVLMLDTGAVRDD